MERIRRNFLGGCKQGEDWRDVESRAKGERGTVWWRGFEKGKEREGGIEREGERQRKEEGESDGR